MKLKIVSGVNISQSIKNAIADIPLDEECFVVVPDRMTLQIEEMLFSGRNISSTFNVNVVGLTNLAIKHVGVALNPISQIEGVMFVKKAIENCSARLSYFKYANMNFCSEIYKFISQLSSSDMSPEDMIFRGTRETLRRKFEDLKTIYSEYLKLTEGREDSSKLVDKFVTAIENRDLFKNTNFYFAGFESFTAKHFMLIKALCKNVKSIVVSLPMAVGKGNAYIYENDILKKLKSLSKEENADIEFISPPMSLNENAAWIVKNLYSNGIAQKNADTVFVFEGKNKKQEAEFVAKTIIYEVYHGVRYKDFSVACGDLHSYAQELKLAFEKHGIPYYFDMSVTAKETYCALLFSKIVSLAYKNYRRDDLLFIALSPLFDFSDRDRRFIVDHAQGGAKIFFALENEQIKVFMKDIACDFMTGAQEVVDFIESQLTKLDDLKLDDKTLEIEKQAPLAIREILNAAQSTANVVEIKSMLSAIDIGLQAKEISAIPSYCDQVYVGDAVQSFFAEPKKLFVIGANASLMPKITSDDSIFSDEDIALAGFKKAIEPTVKMINRRARFKIFSLLTSWTERLYLGYSLADSTGKPVSKSMVAASVIDMFGKSDSIIRSANLRLGENALLFNIGKNKVEAEEVMSGNIPASDKAALRLALQPYIEKFDRIKPLTSAKQLKLGQMIKPTEIEKFYDCPFKVYCENVLHLKEKRLDSLSPSQKGSIIHDALERYAKDCNFAPLDENETEEFIERILSAYDFDAFSDGEIERIRIKKDLAGILSYVSDEYKNSGSEQWLIEEKIEGIVAGKPFYGRVDRVDKLGNKFRVIDYKTGRVTSSLICDLSYGKKLQLFAYASLIGKKSGCDCSGVYYFDIKAKNAARGKKLVGLNIGGDDKNSVPQAKFEELTDMAERLMSKAGDYLSQGKLLPFPDSNSCKYCPFKGICLYDADRGVRRLKGEQE